MAERTEPAPGTRYLRRGAGRVAFDVGFGAGAGEDGDGSTEARPLVICIPGMGDLRSAYSDLAAALRADGRRVATTDLRGHGDSDTTFREHGDAASAGDVLALIEELGGPAVLVGNSMGAAVAVLVAAERPDLVRALVLLGPYVRDPQVPAWQSTALRVGLYLALLPPWGAAVWARAYRRFAVGRDRSGRREKVRGRTPPSFAAHLARVSESQRDRGRLRSLRELTAQLTHAAVEARLGDVTAPTLVIMGAQDPDFPNPARELDYVVRRLTAAGTPVTGHLVQECGHYPHLQHPGFVEAEVAAFLARPAADDRRA